MQYTNMRNSLNEVISTREIRNQIASEIRLSRKERVIAKIASVICHRIEYPRAANSRKHLIGKQVTRSGKRVALSKVKANSEVTVNRAVTLSHWDREDVFSIVRSNVLAYYATRPWLEQIDKDDDARPTWKAIFREVRQTLQMKRHGKSDTIAELTGSLEAMMSEHVTLPPSLVEGLRQDAEEAKARRDALEAKVERELDYALECLSHAREHDKSRKANATYKGMVEFAHLAARVALSEPRLDGQSLSRPLCHYYLKAYAAYLDKGEWFLNQHLDKVHEMGVHAAQVINAKADEAMLYAIGE